MNIAIENMDPKTTQERTKSPMNTPESRTWKPKTTQERAKRPKEHPDSRT